MERITDNGIYEIFIPQLEAGQEYMYEIKFKVLEKRLNIRASDYRFVDKVKYYKGFTTANGQEKNGSQIVELAEISNGTPKTPKLGW